MKNYLFSIIVISVFALLLLSFCNNHESGQNEDLPVNGPIIESEKQKFAVDTITKDLSNPWGIAFLPDKRILVSERAGEIRIIRNDSLLKEKIKGVPEVYNVGQGGLLDLKLHPNYSENGWIYISYSKPGGQGGGTALIRAKLKGNSLTDQELLFETPFIESVVHFGSRIAFDNKGYVFLTSGERGIKENAQDLSVPFGKVLRLHDDGRIPTDNPFVNTPNAHPAIWSYGHRNPQGLFFEESNGVLWEHEHGPKGGDEINIVEKGKNYGWPVITYGIDYNGTPISDISEKEGMEQPIHYWNPSIAPCGMVMVNGKRFSNWKSNLLVGALAHRHVARVELANGKFVKEEKLLKDVGRVRVVAESPEGYIYVATEGPGMLLRLVPAK